MSCRSLITYGLWMLTLLIGSQTVSAADSVILSPHDNHTIDATIGGQPFTTFHYGSELPKPYFSPVRAEDGTIVTRPLDVKEDHPHHKGIWLSIDEINDHKHWAEKHKIANAETTIVKMQGNPAQLKIVNHWLDEAGKPLMKETTLVSIFANRVVAYDIEFSPVDKALTFHDTKEGLFGVRLANSNREKEGGKVVNAEGKQGTKECWGQESAWVDYYGQVNGKIYGVALFDHPGNFRKSRYHVRDYGLFSVSPFGQKAYTNGMLKDAPFTLEPGKTLRLRYGLYVHNGDTKEGHLPETYQQYVKSAE